MVSEYAACIKAGKYTRPKDFERNKYCNIGLAERNNYPANCVDWGEAVDYCQWQGKRLPSEVEWEKAARAGSKSRYPWGQNVSCKNAISGMYAKGNLAGPASGKQRVVRGGSWDEKKLNLRSSFRNVKQPVSGKSIYGSIGFRCASE